MFLISSLTDNQTLIPGPQVFHVLFNVMWKKGAKKSFKNFKEKKKKKEFLNYRKVYYWTLRVHYMLFLLRNVDNISEAF